MVILQYRILFLIVAFIQKILQSLYEKLLTGNLEYTNEPYAPKIAGVNYVKIITAI